MEFKILVSVLQEKTCWFCVETEPQVLVPEFKCSKKIK
jgi:hypothetical protein